MKLPRIDNERPFDWGNTSPDYAEFRAGYPEAFYDVLTGLGIGTPGQRILDLGTGTGVLARAFARRGARVIGVDIAANQIAAAQSLAARKGLDNCRRCGRPPIALPDRSWTGVNSPCRGGRRRQRTGYRKATP